MAPPPSSARIASRVEWCVATDSACSHSWRRPGEPRASAVSTVARIDAGFANRRMHHCLVLGASSNGAQVRCTLTRPEAPISSSRRPARSQLPAVTLSNVSGRSGSSPLPNSSRSVGRKHRACMESKCVCVCAGWSPHDRRRRHRQRHRRGQVTL